MPDASFVCAADLLGDWRNDVLSGKPPILFPVGASGWESIEIGPGRVTLLGGAPGAGKSALAMQWTVDALRMTETLRACVCSVEMAATTLLDRTLSRLSGVPLDIIGHRRLTGEHAERIDLAMNTMQAFAGRLCFVQAPYTLANTAAVADAFNANFIVLDYIQRIPPPGEHSDKRGAIDRTMDHLRRFAAADVALVVLSAVGRGKDRKGRSSYADDALSLASYRESSELEYGCDDAFLLLPDPKAGDRVTLKHLKSRNSEPRDVALIFDRPRQRFTPAASAGDQGPRPDRVKLKAALGKLWASTVPANDETEEDEDDC
jgi:replicative DNA helicase